jgi:putative ABC transport system permease protein
MAVSVADRRREFGVRVALGAAPASLATGVVVHGLRWTAIGVTGGIALALLGGPLLASLLVDIPAWDPLTLAACTLMLFGVTPLATLVPAWRAARVDPWHALRSE